MSGYPSDPVKEIQVRTLIRPGICSCCYRKIAHGEEKVVTFRGKREFVVICGSCFVVAEGKFNAQ